MALKAGGKEIRNSQHRVNRPNKSSMHGHSYHLEAALNVEIPVNVEMRREACIRAKRGRRENAAKRRWRRRQLAA